MRTVSTAAQLPRAPAFLTLPYLGGCPSFFPHRHCHTSEPLVEVERQFEGCCYFIRFITACFNNTPSNLSLHIQRSRRCTTTTLTHATI